MKKNVAIVISTKNNSILLKELLNYYAEIKTNHTIYIGDASDIEHIEETKTVIHSLKNILNIVYKQFPEYGRGQTDNAKTVEKLLHYVNEEYVVESGDDDYFIPKSLDKCVEFLEKNSNYSSAHGYGTFIINNKEHAEKVIIGGRYDINEYMADTASERFKMFVNNYSLLSFSVHRTNVFKKAHKNIDKLPISPPIFEEIMPTSMSSLLGNSKKIDCLYLIRGTHASRCKPIKLVVKIIDMEWTKSLDIYFNTLSDEIAIIDGVEKNIAKETVKQGLINLLEKSLKNYYCKTDPNTFKNKTEHLIKTIKNNIPLNLKNFIKIKLMPKEHYDRSGQLSKSSPYYSELKTILSRWESVFSNNKL